jgi:hypothetical protein
VSRQLLSYGDPLGLETALLAHLPQPRWRYFGTDAEVAGDHADHVVRPDPALIVPSG